MCSVVVDRNSILNDFQSNILNPFQLCLVMQCIGQVCLLPTDENEFKTFIILTGLGKFASQQTFRASKCDPCHYIRVLTTYIHVPTLLCIPVEK